MQNRVYVANYFPNSPFPLYLIKPAMHSGSCTERQIRLRRKLTNVIWGLLHYDWSGKCARCNSYCCRTGKLCWCSVMKCDAVNQTIMNKANRNWTDAVPRFWKSMKSIVVIPDQNRKHSPDDSEAVVCLLEHLCSKCKVHLYPSHSPQQLCNVVFERLVVWFDFQCFVIKMLRLYFKTLKGRGISQIATIISRKY